MAITWGKKTIFAEKTALQKWGDWAKAHQEIIAVAGILLVLTSIGVPFYLHSQAKSESDAKGVLSLAQYYLHSPIDPKNGPFKTPVERDQQALQTFQRILTDFSGTSTAKLARFYVAKTQYSLGQFTQAYSSFDSATRDLSGTPLADESYYGKIISLESQGQLDQAATLSETFLKDHPDSFITPQIRLTLSDIYLNKQNKEKAKEQLQITLQANPDSAWGKEAARRLENLKS